MEEPELKQGQQEPQPSGAPAAAGETEPPQVDQTPDPASLKAEIERLQAAKDKAKEDADYWRRQKVEARRDYFVERPGRPAEQPPPAAAPQFDPEVGQPPKQADFDDYDKYLDAKLEHERKRLKSEWRREEAVRAMTQSRDQRLSSAREKIVSEGLANYPDFEQVVMDDAVPITPVVMEILSESEKPTELAYYLGKNRNVAIQVSRSTPVQAARILARIEAELVKSGGQSPPSPRIPGAPPPIRPVGPSNPVGKDPEKMNQREYEELRIKQGARRF